MPSPRSTPRFLALSAPLALSAAGLAGQEASPADPVAGVDYLVYDAEGRSVGLDDLLAALDTADALLVGEEHGDVIGHALELRILRGALERFGVEPGEAGRPRPVVLSLEMFERDVQPVLDEYLSGLITEDHFLRGSRPWDDYEHRYRPLVELARARALPVVAANAPRRYVNRVTRLGPESLEALPDAARAHLPPLPIAPPSDAYRAEFEAVMAEARAAMRAVADSADAVASTEGDAPEGEDAAAAPGPPNHDASNALHAQSLWDAAMAHAVARALEARPGGLVVHFVGSFHVQNGTGIPERLARYRPAARVGTVVMTAVDDVSGWNDRLHSGAADWVILTRRRAAPASGEGAPPNPPR